MTGQLNTNRDLTPAKQKGNGIDWYLSRTAPDEKFRVWNRDDPTLPYPIFEYDPVTLSLLTGNGTAPPSAASADLSSVVDGNGNLLTHYDAVGTQAQLPAAASRPAGFRFYVTDLNGGTEFRTDGISTWQQIGNAVNSIGGTRLSQASLVPGASVSNSGHPTTFTTLAQLTQTVTCDGVHAVRVRYGGLVNVTVAAHTPYVLLAEDGVHVQVALPDNQTRAAGVNTFIQNQYENIPSAGTHQYTVDLPKQNDTAILTAQAGVAAGTAMETFFTPDFSMSIWTA